MDGWPEGCSLISSGLINSSNRFQILKKYEKYIDSHMNTNVGKISSENVMQ
jgi:hypothetical protein